jgi:hypothetical protein
MTHPPAHELDALAAGDKNPEVEAHVAACEPCSSYVGALGDQVRAFRASADPKLFAARVKARAARSGGASNAGRARVFYMMSPLLAAAAALILWLRAPPRVAPTMPGTASTSESPRFKGERVVAVVRERGGRQERILGPFTVAPGDRIRVEVAVDREGPVTAGLLAADGTWTLLLAPVVLEAGTHFSELAARFDESRTDAVLLVGAPTAVESARRTRSFEDVVAWRVSSESPP